MFPIVITPAKKMQGSHERMYRKSGDVYLNTGRRSEPPEPGAVFQDRPSREKRRPRPLILTY